MSEPDYDWQRARESLRRSRERRHTHRRRRRVAAISKLLVLGVCGGSALGLAGVGVGAGPVVVPPPPPLSEASLDGRQALAAGRTAQPARPRRADVRRARAFAAERGGLVAFAVVDSEGRLHGFRSRARFPAASVVKAPLLVARLRDLERRGDPLTPDERGRLEAMVRWSDNDAADAVYDSVGDPALIETVRRAGMRRFTIAGHWGNAQLTAADTARFMSNLRRLLKPGHRRFAMSLLGSIVPAQRRGIAELAPSWNVWMKGGWVMTRRGELINKAALLERRERRIALAILTDAQPNEAYATDTLLGIAARLLGRKRSDRAD